jgi:hypothetical protein
MMISLLTAVVLAASPVSLQFDGTLKDGLKELAQKSGLNLVVIGELDEKVNLNLPGIDGEAALETIAEAYQLEITRSTKAEKLWVVKRKTAAPVAVVAPVDAEALREKADQLREEADETREAAKEKAEELKEQTRAVKELARSEEDVARAKAELARHRVSTGGPVTVEPGSTVDNAVAYGGPVIVNEGAVVKGDAVAFGGDVILAKGAVVSGDAVAFGGNVVRDEGAIVRGETVSLGGTALGKAMADGVVKSQQAQRSEEPDEDHMGREGFGHDVAGFLLQFAVFFGLGFVLMLFAPQRMKTLEATIRSEPGTNGLAGFLCAVALVPLTLMLIVTLVGIPVALLMWAAIGLLVPVGLAVVANAVGTKLPTGRMRKTQALALAIGLFAMLLVSRIPGIGPVVLTGAVFVSMGAIIRTRFGQQARGTPQMDPMHATV